MRKIKGKGKLLLYGAAGMGINLLNLIMGSYLCSALIADGFAPAAVANQTFCGINLVVAEVWAVFALAAKILDGIIDIPMASLTDRLKSRWGRRRPSLIMGLIPLIATYLLFLVIPDHSGATLWNTIYYGVMLCLFYCSYTLVMVTYYATFTEIVDTVEERNFISNVKSVCDILYFIIGYVVVIMLLKNINIRTVALISLPVAATMLIPLFMIKEPSTKDGNFVAEKTVDLFKSLGYTFKNKDFIIWMVVYSFMTFGVQLFLAGINEYFSVTGMSMILVMATSFAPVPLTLILYNKIIKKKGFKFAYQYVILIFALSMGSLFAISFLENGTLKTLLSVVGGLICSFSVGALFAVAYSVPSQLAAEDEKRTGISHSAMYFAVQGLFAGVASGIASGVVLTALKVNGIVTYLTLISAGGCLLSFIFTYLLPKSVANLGKRKDNEISDNVRGETGDSVTVDSENGGESADAEE